MDSYIQRKKKQIKAIRKEIRFLYWITFPILIFLILFVTVFATNWPPETWKEDEVIFSHVFYRSSARGSGNYVFCTPDGRQFLLNRERHTDWENVLVRGESYSVVYTKAFFDAKPVKALANKERTYVDLEESVEAWENEQKKYVIAIVITIILEIIAVCLIDRLWCKKEYARIKQLKVDIEYRKARIQKEAAGK